MPGARTSIFCERCSAMMSVGRDSANAHFCAACGSYVCNACWDGALTRCMSCAGLAAVRPHGPHASLVWATKAFRQLNGVRPELEALDAQVDRRARDARALQRRLLLIRAEDSTSAALRALAAAPPTDEVRSIRQQVEIERLRVAGMSREPKARKVALPHVALAQGALPHVALRHLLRTLMSPLRAGWSRLWSIVRIPRISRSRVPHPAPRSLTTAAVVLAGAGGVAMVVLIGAAIRPTDARPPIAAIDSPSPEGQVAGGNPSPSPRPSAPAPILATFDELAIGAPLPTEFRVLGDANQVQVAAFPTPFDRSLRLTSPGDGAATSVCHVMDPAATRIAVDLFAPQPDGLAVTLRNPRSGLQVGIVVASLGTVLIQPSGEPMVGTAIGPSKWQRVTLFHDAVGGMRAAIGTPGPTAPSLDSSSPLPGWQPGEAAGEVCIESPRLQGAELFVDNLVIE